MDVEFWFDPACPFCWMTSRWVNDITPERDLHVTWRTISLLIKNNTQPDSPFYERVTRTRELLRVVEAARASGHGDRIGALYTAFGDRIHHRKELHFDVAPVLAEVGLDTGLASGLAAAAADASYDDAIRASMEDGLALTGPDVGTPIIAIGGRAGRVALFGPVITTFPDATSRLALWDGFVAMANVNGFFELKRTRTAMPELPPHP